MKIKLLQCILFGEYILADRFLRNCGYLVAREVVSTFGCQIPSKRNFEKSKNTEVCLNLTLKWQNLRCFFAIKINIHLVQYILCGQYILADRFLRNNGYLVEHALLSTFGVSFHPKEVLRNPKIPKFA